jgi:hypothetical protein
LTAEKTGFRQPMNHLQKNFRMLAVVFSQWPRAAAFGLMWKTLLPALAAGSPCWTRNLQRNHSR